MQINPTDPIGGASRPTGPRPVGDRSVQRDAAAFAESAALHQAWDQVPAVRPAEVARGTALVQSQQYPPASAIHQIARLLASNLRSNGE